MDNIQELDALAEVMTDAGALTCVQCGKRAAVHASPADDLSDDFVWCFECGHEERLGQ